MSKVAGVVFYERDGITPRTGDIKVDFTRLIGDDSMIGRPPGAVTETLRRLGELDRLLDLARLLIPRRVAG